MGIIINNLNRREEYDQIAQLQNQINSYLANPNVDESAKSSARKQLEELSASVNTYGSRKEARKFAISTLNSIASSLKTSEDYTPEYVAPSSGLPYIETFNPEMVSNRYNVAGIKPDLNKTVQEFSDFLAQQLTHAQGVLSDNGKVLYGWNKANTNQINTWLTELAKQPVTEQAAKEKIGYMGNVIVNALANEKLAQAFENKFAPWLEGSEEYEAVQAAAAAEAQKAAKNPADLAAYPTLTSKGYIFEKGSDGKYTAYQAKDDGTKGDKAGQAGYMNPDFTSSGYKSGWIIGPNGVVTLINDFSDVTTYRDYLQTEGWEEAISNAKDALLEKYPNAFNFTNTFDQNPFGEGIAHGNKNFVDLSYYFPGEGYVLGVQKDTDADNFEGYNWNEEDREFYVSKDGQNWEIVKGMEAVRTLLGLDEGAGFKYEGADILADPEILNKSQFNRAGYLNRPEDWDLVGANIHLKPIKGYTEGEKRSAIAQIIQLVQPGQYNKVAKTLTPERRSDCTDIITKSINKVGHKQFYKWLFTYAQQQNLPKYLLAGLIEQYRDPNIDEYGSEEEVKAYLDTRKTVSKAKGGVLKFSAGGEPWYVLYANEIPDNNTNINTELATQSSENLGDVAKRAAAAGRTVEGQEKGEGKFEWDAAMVMRAGALAADVAGLIASFVPVYGTAGAAVAGATSLGLDMAADINDPSVTGGQVALNAAANLAFGIVGLIPGGKVWKVTKNLAKYGLFLTQMGVLSPAIYLKLTSDLPLTYDDWKAVYAGLSALTGTASNIATAAKLKRLKVDTTPTKTGKHKAKAVGSNQEYEFTTAELEKIAIEGETKGQDAAVAKIKEILKQKYPNQAEAIENVDLGILYGTAKRGERSSLGWKWYKRWHRPRTIQDVTTPITVAKENLVADFYANNPYRKGNPYNPKDWDESLEGKVGWFASDYALANGVRTSLIGGPWRLPEWEFLKALKAWGQDLTMGPGYQSRHNKRAEVEIGNTKHVRNIPKDHELIKVKNGDQEQVVELAPLKNNNNETVPNEYVNVKDKNEIYTKTADGKFEKKTVNLTTEPNKPKTDLVTETNKSRLYTQEDIDEFNSLMNRESTPKTGIEHTTTEASHQTYSKYVSLAHKARNQGKKLLNKDEVNELLSKMATVTNQEYKPAKTGGFVVNGKLTYNRSGGKLNRLNNYLNNK